MAHTILMVIDDLSLATILTYLYVYLHMYVCFKYNLFPIFVGEPTCFTGADPSRALAHQAPSLFRQHRPPTRGDVSVYRECHESLERIQKVPMGLGWKY